MSYSPFRLFAIVLIIAANGFFAAAEVALLSVRHSRLRQMAEAGQTGAQAALSLLANPGRLLSVTQVGVTLTSLGLGWAGEDAIFQMLTRLFHPLINPSTAAALHAVIFVLSFLVITYLHVVFGEVAPKNLAISNADRLAALVAPALLVFYRISLPFVVVLEGSAAAITRALKLKEAGHGSVHSAEELKLIVSSSRGMGYLSGGEEEMLHRVLELGDISVREVMTPRNDMVSISAGAPLDEVIRAMIAERHSRLPVWEGSKENIIGIIHYKDLLPVWEERRNSLRSGRPNRAFRVSRLLRPHLVAPETKPLSQMLDEFRQGRSHMAMVVDEHGTISGMLTVEDVLEQLVGRIEDEYDDKAPRRHLAEDLELDGATRIRDLETEYGIPLPASAGFETLAGFLLYQLGEIPAAGAEVIHEGRRFLVLEMQRNRIARVRIERLPAATAAAAEGK